MKLKILFLLVAAILSFFYLWNIPSLHLPNNETDLNLPAVAGFKDNPHARADHEFEMLRDPSTNKIPHDIRRKELEFAKSLPQIYEKVMSKDGRRDNIQALTWTERGPNNLGGRIRALGIDVRTTTTPTIIAGGVSGGLWKSTDDGSNWTKTTTASQLHSVTCLAQDTRSGSEDTWYAGTGETLGNSASASGSASYRGDGIYKSTDNGDSWSLLASTDTGKPEEFDQHFDYVSNLAVHPTNGDVYAAAGGSIFRSTNGGTSWTNVLGSAGSATSRMMDVQVTSDGSAIYAALSTHAISGGDSVYRSTNGTTWKSISKSVTDFPTVMGRTVIACAPSEATVVYFLMDGVTSTGSSTNGHQIWKYRYKSGDGSGSGGAWVNRGGNLPDNSGGDLAGNDPFDSQGGYDLCVFVSPSDTNFVIVGGTNLYTSTDGFATNSNWKRIGGYAAWNTFTRYTNHHPDLHAGVFKPGSSIIFYSGSDDGVHKTTDVSAATVSWTSLNDGFNSTQFYSVSLAPESSSDIVMGGMQDNGTWYLASSGLQSWSERETGDGTIVTVAPSGDDRIYTAYQFGGIRSRERDGTFIQDFSPPAGTSGVRNQRFVNPSVLDPNDSNILYYGGGDASNTTGIWRNDDVNHASNPVGQWTFLTSSKISGGTSVEVSAIGVSDASSANVVYYGLNSGAVYRIDAASTGSSPTVTTVTGGSFPSGFVSSIAVDPTNSAKAIVVFSNYKVNSLWYTTDSGSNWTDVEGNLSGDTGPSIRFAEIFYISGTLHVFLATSIGVYYTNVLNGGSTTWTAEAASSIGNVVTTYLDYRDNDGTLAAATHGRGVFTTEISTPLPVELISFTGKYNKGTVNLYWVTATEINNYGFDVERSTHLISNRWEKIGFVEGYGNSNSNREYHFVDHNLPGSPKIHYRLKQIDVDGQFEYSSVFTIINRSLAQFLVKQNYPNPFNPSTKINYQIITDSNVKVEVYSVSGELVAELINEMQTAGDYSITFDTGKISGGLASGIYLYRISAENLETGLTSVQNRKMMFLK